METQFVQICLASTAIALTALCQHEELATEHGPQLISLFRDFIAPPEQQQLILQLAARDIKKSLRPYCILVTSQPIRTICKAFNSLSCMVGLKENNQLVHLATTMHNMLALADSEDVDWIPELLL